MKGHWWHGRQKRRFNKDVTKLQFAIGLTTEENNLLKYLQFLSSPVAGIQQIRITIGQALFSGRVMLADPLFRTISTNTRLHGLCIRLSRYRDSDPMMVHAPKKYSPWHKFQNPRIWVDETKD